MHVPRGPQSVPVCRSALSDSCRLHLHCVLKLVLVESRNVSKALLLRHPSSMPPPSFVHLLPAEILSIIFLLVIDYPSDCVQLMRVCRHWYDVMLSTPGIPYILRIGKSTTLEMVRVSIQGTRWLLNVQIDMDDESIGQDFNAGAFDACFTAAIEVASRWEYLWIYSLPRPGKCKAFQIVPPLKSLKLFYLGQGCDLGGFFEPLMTAITTTATPQLTYISLESLDAVLFLVKPDCLHVFCSLTTLYIWLSKRMESPVNILPHLQRLESFTARHIHLPIYPHSAPLPLIQTLRYLRLKSVSVQWMAGKAFSVLQTCDITFPHHIDTIRLQPVTMPACAILTYKSNNLDSLRYFHDLPITELTVKSGQWNVRRGNLQLIPICHLILPCAQSLTGLDLQVRCSEQLLVYMLSLLPALSFLGLRLASPRALNEVFFQKFVATKSYAGSPCEMGGLPSLPLCLKLTKLNLNYKRWLRGPERTALLLVFGDIVSSRRSEGSFQLRLGVKGFAEDWFIWGHVESIHGVANDEPFAMGISSLHGIIPLVPDEDDLVTEVPFKEAEYLVARHELSIECLSTLHHLVELRVGGDDDVLPSEPPPNLPLFHTLRVLEAENIHYSFFAGQIFHKLERCRISICGEGPELSKEQVTQMPVCTRLDVADLTLLATLKLPQICELGVSFYHPEFEMIWEKHIAVNANLSGLELLHVYAWYHYAGLIQALQCLPVLKTLVLADGSDLDVMFFGELVRWYPNETTRLMQSYDEGRILPILCPMLTNLLIEDYDPTEPVELIPILKEVITLRAMCSSPLKRFTLTAIKFGRKCELIGSQGGLVTEMDSLDEPFKPFRLDI